jgi:hypothetical protein
MRGLLDGANGLLSSAREAAAAARDSRPTDLLHGAMTHLGGEAPVFDDSGNQIRAGTGAAALVNSDNPVASVAEVSSMGDLPAAMDAGRAALKGDWPTAGLMALSVLPGMPGLARGARGAATPNALRAEGSNVGGLLRTGNSGGQLNMMPWEGPFFSRDVPSLEGTVQTPAGLLIPAPRTARSGVSPHIDAIANNPNHIMRGMDMDVDNRLMQGRPSDEPWYQLGGVKESLDQLNGPLDFTSMNILGGVASQSNSVPMENAIMSVMHMARTRGMSFQDAMKEYHRLSRDPASLNTYAAQFADAEKKMGKGFVIASDPYSQNWKTPSYSMIRRGGGGVNDPVGRHLAPLDAHERKRLGELALEDPQIAKAMDLPYIRKRETGELISAAEEMKLQGGQLPLRNAQDYRAIVDAIYEPGARRYSMPTGGAYQALRWEGGANRTGIRSPVGLSYQQILEQQLRESLRFRGQDPTFRNMESLWNRIGQGQDVINMPAGWRSWADK